MVIDRRLVANALKRHEYGKGGKFHKFQEGKNMIRLLPFKHTVNEFDVAAGRFGADMLGQEIEHFFCDVNRLWRSNRFANCLLDEDECPIWQDYWNRPKEQRKEYRPRPLFVVNAIDLEEQHKGVQLMELSRAVFMGPRNTQGTQLGFGVYNLYNGFDPTEGDEADEDEEGAGGGGILHAIPGVGDDMLGLKGRDIIIKMKKGRLGLEPNTAAQNGAMVLRKEDACSSFDGAYLKQVKDLFELDKYFPGFAQAGAEHHLWPLVGQFQSFLSGESTGINPEEGDDEQEEAPATSSTTVQKQNDGTTNEEASKEEEAPEVKDEAAEEAPQPVAKKKAKRKSKKKTAKKVEATPIVKGTLVYAIDKLDEDDNSLPEEEWTKYRGVFHKWSQEGGKSIGNVLLKPEDQDEEQRLDLAENMSEAGAEEQELGGLIFEFPQDAISVRTEEIPF